MKQVAKGGLLPAAGYSDPVTGITNAALRDYRRIHAAAAMVQCSGSSLTAKLAIGGDDYAEYDPAVLHCNPPLMSILRKIWDQPSARSDFSGNWWRARDDIRELAPNERWRRAGGPVMAAWLHFLRIGIEWKRPFLIEALDNQVDLLKTSPKQVLAVVTAHARRHYDRALISRLCVEHGWQQNEMTEHCQHGIDRVLPHAILRGKVGGVALRPEQRRGLELLIRGGFWPEQRRWNAGMRDTPECVACGAASACEVHRVHDCDAMHFDMVMAQAGGTLPREPEQIRSPRLAPLLARGLPPKPLPWEPVPVSMTEGCITPEPSIAVYGDGSGYLQEVKELRGASWWVVTIGHDCNGEWRREEAMRGGVHGWFPTVPRGEFPALLNFLRCSGPNAQFVTDCQGVADGMHTGIPDALTSSGSFNADLWKEARGYLRDREVAPTVIKTKAHRARAAALLDAEDHVGHWYGNQCADAHAKSLAKSMIEAPKLDGVWHGAREVAIQTLRRAAFGVAWALRCWPELEKKKPTGPHQIQNEADQDTGHMFHRRQDGGIECTLCRRVARGAKGARRLRREVCGGSILHHIDESHAIRFSAGVTWCDKCGGFTTRWPRSLLLPCKGKPWSADRRNVLRRLRQGLTPSAATHFQRALTAGGAPANAPDHSGTLTWSTGKPGETNNTPGVVDATRMQLAAMTSRGVAVPPSRTYSRLPAYRQAAARPRDDGPSESTPEAPAAGGGTSGGKPDGVWHCNGLGAWTSRLKTLAIARRAPCDLCGCATLTLCKGCGGRLCLQCARGRKVCSAAKLANSLGPERPVDAPRPYVGAALPTDVERDDGASNVQQGKFRNSAKSGLCQQADPRRDGEPRGSIYVQGSHSLPRHAMVGGSRADFLRSLTAGPCRSQSPVSHAYVADTSSRARPDGRPASCDARVSNGTPRGRGDGTQLYISRAGDGGPLEDGDGDHDSGSSHRRRLRLLQMLAGGGNGHRACASRAAAADVPADVPADDADDADHDRHRMHGQCGSGISPAHAPRSAANAPPYPSATQDDDDDGAAGAAVAACSSLLAQDMLAAAAAAAAAVDHLDVVEGWDVSLLNSMSGRSCDGCVFVYL